MKIYKFSSRTSRIKMFKIVLQAYIEKMIFFLLSMAIDHLSMTNLNELFITNECFNKTSE